MPSQDEIDILLKDFRKKISIRYANKTSKVVLFVIDNLVDCMGGPTETEQEFVEQYKILYEFLEEKEKQQAEQIIEEMLVRTKGDMKGEGTNTELMNLNKKILNTKTELSRE